MRSRTSADGISPSQSHSSWWLKIFPKISTGVSALNGGRPQMMTLAEIIKAFVEFREEVITRRTIFELNKARALKGGNVHLCGNPRAKFAIIIGVH